MSSRCLEPKTSTFCNCLQEDQRKPVDSPIFTGGSGWSLCSEPGGALEFKGPCLLDATLCGSGSLLPVWFTCYCCGSCSVSLRSDTSKDILDDFIVFDGPLGSSGERRLMLWGIAQSTDAVFGGTPTLFSVEELPWSTARPWQSSRFELGCLAWHLLGWKLIICRRSIARFLEALDFHLKEENLEADSRSYERVSFGSFLTVRTCGLLVN